RSARDPESICARRQGPIHCGLEFFRLAFDEVTVSCRSLRLDSLCRAPGLLLVDRAGLRVGADAAWNHGKGRRVGVEPAGLGAADGEDQARTTDARGEPVAQGGRGRTADGG